MARNAYKRVDERFCTGKDTSDWEKFEKWAATVPYTMRNPLYHRTHLELKTGFGVTKLLNPDTAKEIYDECTAKLRTPQFSARGLMKHYNVKVVCTTDDPIDDLQYHIALKNEGFEVKVLPRGDRIRQWLWEVPANFRAYVEKLSEVSGVRVGKFSDLIAALRNRHDFSSRMQTLRSRNRRVLC